jgi:hypothetical protein
MMLMGAFTFVTAAEETAVVNGHIAEPEGGWKTSNVKPTIDYFSGKELEAEYDDEGKFKGYVPVGDRIVYDPETKLAKMDLRYVQDGYELYVDAYSGEVATKCIATGEVLFSNPCTVGNYGSSKMTDTVMSEVMSQLVVKYTDISTGEWQYYHSYEWAASRGQIVVRNIKNGIRVEYTIGREEARLLVPHMIAISSFESKLETYIKAAVGDKNDPENYDPDIDFLYQKFKAYYLEKDPSKVTNEVIKQNMLTEYPITKKIPVYVLDVTTSESEKAKLEMIIKTYCPDYSYEDLDEDHLLVGYEATDKNPPLFKMALEYSLDSNGMTVRLPANGIRFNESLYRLEEIRILPYMGAAADNEGYNFFPDGSGTLFDYEKIKEGGLEISLNGKLYGNDFAYHTIDGKLEEILRYPVFGLVENEDLSKLQPPITNVTPEEGETDTEAEKEEPKYKKRGFVAIVEEGDALMQLSSYHMGSRGVYNTMMMTVFPRPKDEYNLAEAISVGENKPVTVVSARKYTGNFKIRYIMLTDDAVAAEKGITNYYTTSYTGMALAYRSYLESIGMLTRLKADEVKENIPLYVETFGAIFSTKKILSIPFDVTVPLTSFDDIVKMYDELAGNGIDNVNFIMKYYTDGGIDMEKVPYNLKWENAVEGDYKFEDLLKYSEDKDFGIYPDFDFVFFQNNSLFDGLTLKKHAVKTIDNRYTSKRDYSATKQTHVGYYELAISPAYFNHFYEKLTENYADEYGAKSISVSTLGAYLNSDFDEDEPFNREDSKNFTAQAFEYLSSKYDNVLTEGGNYYTWKYVDHITDVALDSSRYAQSSASVPFLGIVLHGYVEYAGSAINMEGNIEYAMLKAIENGAALKFILSYQNTSELKKWENTSQYYSIRYDIWLEDVISLYNELNAILAGVQTSTIVRHEFLNNGIRVPDDDEILNDVENAVKNAIANKLDANLKDSEAQIDAYRVAREDIIKIANVFLNGTKYNDSLSLGNYNDKLSQFSKEVNTILTATTADEVTANWSTLLGYAKFYVQVGVGMCELYERAKIDYCELISKDDTLSQAKKDELIAYINSVDVNAICTNNTVESFNAKFKSELKAAYDKAVELGATDIGESLDAIIESVYKDAGVNKEEPEAELEKDDTFKTYPADDNKVVYEEFDNGTVFLLNFNNYRVMIELGDKTYTIEAYGYIVFNKAN